MSDCEALTFADGSWHCVKCKIGGDKDEPPETFCPQKRLNGPAAADYSEIEARVLALDYALAGWSPGPGFYAPFAAYDMGVEYGNAKTHRLSPKR